MSYNVFLTSSTLCQWCLDESPNSQKSQFAVMGLLPQAVNLCSLLFAEKQIIKLTYDDKVQLTAFWKQISSGAYDPEKYPDVGYFDVIGNDRR